MSGPERSVACETPREAWIAAVSLLLDAPDHRMSNLVVRIARPLDVDHEFTTQLDAGFSAEAGSTVRAVARTIVPRAVVEATDWERATFRLLPNLPKHGSYFRRMVDFADDGGSVNQISAVIGAFNRRTPSDGHWTDPGPIILERPGQGLWPALVSRVSLRYNSIGASANSLGRPPTAAITTTTKPMETS